MNIFLDTNIALDLLLKNRNRKEKVVNILSKITLEHESIQNFMSAKSVADVYYISRKELSKNQIDQFLRDITILDSTAVACNFAITNTDKHDDIEDIMQIVCCNENKINLFITADPKLIEDYGQLFNCKTKFEIII